MLDKLLLLGFIASVIVLWGTTTWWLFSWTRDKILNWLWKRMNRPARQERKP
jgi:hypothetical protein